MLYIMYIFAYMQCDNVHVMNGQERSTSGESTVTRPWLLVLVGLPGAGKSTFSKTLQDSTPNGTNILIRINQDSISEGTKRKKGTKQQCLEACDKALSRSERARVVVIDRTNLTPDQRYDFIALGKQKHVKGVVGIVFDVPAKVCAQRAAARVGHEGGVQGRGAYPVVHSAAKTFQAAGMPELSEGFTYILRVRCRHEVDQLHRFCKTALICTDATEHHERGDTGREPTSHADLASMLERIWKESGRENDTSLQHCSTAEEQSKAEGTLEQCHDAVACVQRELQQVTPSSASKRKKDQHHPPQAAKIPAGANAFDVMMAHARQRSSIVPASQTNTVMCNNNVRKEESKSHHTFRYFPGSNVLVAMATTPPNHAVYTDDSVIVIPDKYPKAKFHYLVIARQKELLGPLDICMPRDLSLLKHMQHVATTVVQQRHRDMSTTFHMGFHSIPSLPQLHLHVISHDFASPCMKTTKHWNSFTTDFFLPLDRILGGTTISYRLEDKKALLSNYVQCPTCHATFTRLALVQDHYKHCQR